MLKGRYMLKTSLSFHVRSLFLRIKYARKEIIFDPSVNLSNRCSLETSYGGSIQIGKHTEIHEYVLINSYGGKIE
jgi:hypothetical protein